jgi:DNA-binding response OmpR family regulator
MVVASTLPRPNLLTPSRPLNWRHSWRSPVTRRWSSEATGGRVLLIDDDQSLLSLLAAIFRAAGFQVTSAADAMDGLEKVRTANPDVIVLDLEMPGMNGREFYRQLRAQDNQTPVLILSAYNARSAQLELGAQAYTSKPFDPDELVETVRGLIQA